MRPLKIVMLHPHDIYSAREPWTIRIVEIARELTRKGHKVKLIYFPLPAQERGLLKSSRITEFETIPFSRRSYHLLKNIMRFSSYAKWADIIHLQKCFPNAAIPALFGAWHYRKPLHYDWDDWEYEIYNFSPPSKLFGEYINIMEKMVPQQADTVSVASHRLKELALGLGVSGQRIVMAPVGVNLERFKPGYDSHNIREKYGLKKNVILYLGQLNGAQYAQLAIRAFPQVLKSVPDSSLLVVGGGSDLENLKKLVRDMNLEESIIFTGFLKDEDIPLCIACADVAVACFEKNKITECKSPLKIVEYLGSGKAIVASDVGEVRRMIGDAGIVVKPGDPDSLAYAIAGLLSDPERRKNLELGARKRAEEIFNWTKTAESLLSAYERSLILQ